jgi:hypothetical protein
MGRTQQRDTEEYPAHMIFFSFFLLFFFLYWFPWN